MKASELRIGNFLLCYGKVRQVVDIGLNGFLATSQEGQSFNISGTNYKGMKVYVIYDTENHIVLGCFKSFERAERFKANARESIKILELTVEE